MGVDPTVSQREIGSSVGAFSVITNLRMDFFEALLAGHHRVQPWLQPVLHRAGGGLQDQESLPLLPLQRLLRGHPQQAPQRRHRHLPLRVRPALVSVITQSILPQSISIRRQLMSVIAC